MIIRDQHSFMCRSYGDLTNYIVPRVSATHTNKSGIFFNEMESSEPPINLGLGNKRSASQKSRVVLFTSGALWVILNEKNFLNLCIICLSISDVIRIFSWWWFYGEKSLRWIRQPSPPYVIFLHRENIVSQFWTCAWWW